MGKEKERLTQTKPMVISPAMVEYILQNYGGVLFPVGTVLKFKHYEDSNNPNHVDLETGIVNGEGICEADGILMYVPVWCETCDDTLMVALKNVVHVKLPENRATAL